MTQKQFEGSGITVKTYAEVRKAPSQKKQLGTIKKPHKGMSLFVFNPQTGNIKLASVQDDATYDIKKKGSKKTLEVNSKLVYFWALNLENAKRKVYNQVNK